MDPIVQELSVRLAEATVRNTANAVFDRVAALRTKKRDQETITELEQIINELLDDKVELVRIAQSYEEQLVAQRISEDEIAYIAQTVVPLMTRLAAAQGGADQATEQMISVLEPLISVETVTVLQLLGFNFKRAIGEPLTDLLATQIGRHGRAEGTLEAEAQLAQTRRELAYLEVVKDPEAWERLRADQ